MDNLSSMLGMGANDPLQLADLRQKRKRELELSMASNPDSRTSALLSMLQGDINEDPGTGLAAHKQQADIEAMQRQGFHNPEEMRQHQEAEKYRLATDPARIAGEYGVLQEREKGLAAAGKPTGQIRVMNIRDESGQDRSVMVNSAGEILFAGQSQLPAGMKKNEADVGDLIRQVKSLREAGEANNYGATGPWDTFAGKIKSAFGQEDPANTAYRAALGSVRAGLTHEKYGSALTEQEIRFANNFIPSEWSFDANNRAKLAVLEAALMQRHQELLNGATVDTATPLTDIIAQKMRSR